jgi:FLVCR family feline leukemia virus subgroup C receptor-related protein
MIPIIPIILQFSCELVFPVGEASSTGFLYASGQFLGFALGLLFLSFLDGKNKWRTQLVTLIFGGLNLLGVLVLLLIK